MTEQTIHPRALPNDLPVESLHLRPDAEGAVRLDPARAGWRYLSFETHHIGRGGLVVAAAGEDVETCLVVLNGGGRVGRRGRGSVAARGSRRAVRGPALRALAARRPRTATGLAARGGD